jgi:predicted MPP superfamily phosphohydrolase
MTRERLMDVVAKVNIQSPDMVVITGDFVHQSPENYVNDLTFPLSRLTPKDGVFAVLGNHDQWTNPSLVRNILETANIIDLSNRVHVLESGSATMSIAGVDDVWEGQDQLDLVLDALPDEGATILLVHEPDYTDISSETGRFDLQLSGHTHGGQVVLPFADPLILPTYGQQYPSGLYLTNGMYHYTNRGVGMIDPVVRFNCRPEVTIFTLRSSEK